MDTVDHKTSLIFFFFDLSYDFLYNNLCAISTIIFIIFFFYRDDDYYYFFRYLIMEIDRDVSKTTTVVCIKGMS